MAAGDTSEAAWDSLRATRWDPPGPASKDVERRRTYVLGLEQAEQMFRAAAVVGPATRPLLVFYGLSQAGRAIAAAASSVKTSDGWRLEGHGIRSMPQSLSGPLPDIRVEPDRRPGSKGSFVRLSELLGSQLWDKAFPAILNMLWDILPENRLSPLRDSGKSRRTPIRAMRPELFEEPHPLASITVAYFPPWMVDSPEGRKEFLQYLSSFPEMREFDSFYQESGEPDASPFFHPHSDGWGELSINWRLPPTAAASPSGSRAFVMDRTRRYNGSSYFFPALGMSDRSLHPLMAWWAVLHTLSMLARYQPAEWGMHINVDASPHAVQLERILKEAISILPNLIAEAIDQVVNPRCYLESVDGSGPGRIGPDAW